MPIDAQYNHATRTNKQPLMWHCYNPECSETKDDKQFGRYAFTSDEPKCPKCTMEGPPSIQLAVLIHLLVPDPKGKIGSEANRYRIACDPARDYLALTDNNEAATDVPKVANCPGCLKSAPKGALLVDTLGRPLKVGKDTTSVKK